MTANSFLSGQRWDVFAHQYYVGVIFFIRANMREHISREAISLTVSCVWSSLDRLIFKTPSGLTLAHIALGHRHLIDHAFLT